MTGPRDSWVPGAGIPIAPPIEVQRRGPGSAENQRRTTSAGTNTSADITPEPQRPERRISRQVLSQLDQTMPLRDRLVLEQIARHRFLSTAQVRRLEFVQHSTEESAIRTARVVLGRLEKTGLIRALDRRVGGFHAGSSSKIWQLAPAGARLLREDGTDFRAQEPSPRFLLHSLGVGDVHIELLTLRDEPQVQRIDVQLEPDCWRRYSGTGGERQWLQPDLAATVYADDYIDRWFIEVDLGTESQPTLLKKCARYETYRATGQAEVGDATFPLVVWVMTDARRAKRLLRAIEHSARLTPALYRVVTADQLPALLRSGG